MWRMKSSCRATQRGTDQKSLRIPHHFPPGSAGSALPLLQLFRRQGWADGHYRIPKVPGGKLTAPRAAQLLHRHPLHFIFRKESISFIAAPQPAQAQAGNCSIPQDTANPHRSFLTKVAGLLCFSVRWIILCPLGLIPKSFPRKLSYQLSSVNCLITLYPTGVKSNKGWSPLHCAPEHHICITRNLSPLQPPPGLTV